MSTLEGEYEGRVLELLERPANGIKKGVGFSNKIIEVKKKIRKDYLPIRAGERWLKRQMKISRLTSEISRGARKKHYPRQQTKKKKVMPSPLRIYKFDYLLKLKAVASNFKKYQAVAAAGQLRRRRGHYYLLNLKKTTSRLRRNQVSLFKKKKFDGKFRSRVLNKMIGIFTKEGKRKKAAKHVYTAFLILSYLYNVSPLLVLEESVVKNLPIFLLKKYIVRRTQIKEYPVLAKKEKKIKTTIK